MSMLGLRNTKADTEYLQRGPLSSMRLCGFSPGQATPGANTGTGFRKELIVDDAPEALFARFDRPVFKAMNLQIVRRVHRSKLEHTIKCNFS